MHSMFGHRGGISDELRCLLIERLCHESAFPHEEEMITRDRRVRRRGNELPVRAPTFDRPHHDPVSFGAARGTREIEKPPVGKPRRKPVARDAREYFGHRHRTAAPRRNEVDRGVVRRCEEDLVAVVPRASLAVAGSADRDRRSARCIDLPQLSIEREEGDPPAVRRPERVGGAIGPPSAGRARGVPRSVARSRTAEPGLAAVVDGRRTPTAGTVRRRPATGGGVAGRQPSTGARRRCEIVARTRGDRLAGCRAHEPDHARRAEQHGGDRGGQPRFSAPRCREAPALSPGATRSREAYGRFTGRRSHSVEDDAGVGDGRAAGVFGLRSRQRRMQVDGSPAGVSVRGAPSSSTSSLSTVGQHVGDQSRPRRACRPVSISQSTTPKAQMSARRSARGRRRACSGAM